MFEKIPSAAVDPILGLAELFQTDERFEKIDLSIGVYQDETGNIPILSSVKKAERYLLENEKSKNYLKTDGITEFARCTQEQLFGTESSIISNARARTIQTPGGTSALRLAADFLAKNTDVKRVWLSNPSWPNHKNIFHAAGLEVHEYFYYDRDRHTINFDRLLNSLNEVQSGDVILFHSCCHNPTGIDPTLVQWEILAKLSSEKGWLPLFDFAYQGFASGLEEDAQSLRLFADAHQELIITNSYSKNFALYNERVGACTLVAANRKIADRSFSQMKAIIRANYSSPPAHGAAVVTTILNNYLLRSIWEKELSDMRNRIQHMRKLFVTTLKKTGTIRNFSFILKQKGMFSYTGLTKEQILRLRKEFGVYALTSSRFNIAAMTKKNIPLVCKAIVSII